MTPRRFRFTDAPTEMNPPYRRCADKGTMTPLEAENDDVIDQPQLTVGGISGKEKDPRGRLIEEFRDWVKAWGKDSRRAVRAALRDYLDATEHPHQVRTMNDCARRFWARQR